MKIQYEDTINEAVDVQYDLAVLMGDIQRLKWIGFIAPTIVFVMAFFIIRSFPANLILGLIVAGILLALHMMTYRSGVRRRLRRAIARTRGADAPVTCEYEMDETGMRIRQLGQELKFDWKTVENVETTLASIKITLKPPGIATIPTRAFASTEQKEDWLEYIQQAVKLSH